jgi:hypothetical protein
MAGMTKIQYDDLYSNPLPFKNEKKKMVWRRAGVSGFGPLLFNSRGCLSKEQVTLEGVYRMVDGMSIKVPR